MKIRIRSNRGSVALGVLVLIVVSVFLIGLFTLVSRAGKIKARTLPAEDTNSFYHLHRPDLYFASPPQQADPNPPAFKAKAAATAPTYTSHTNSLSFALSDAVEDGLVLVLRTEDFVNWTVLQWVLFDEPVFTNDLATIRFVDLYAPSAGSFYKGLLILNQ